MSARDDVTGKGKAKFWERSDRSDFQVEAEGAADGTYTLQVCGEDRGEMEIAGGEGEMTFRSPANDSTMLLDFDPRDCPIDLLDGDGIALTSGDAVLAEKQKGKKDDDEGEGIEIKVDLNNVGVIEGAKGEAGFGMDSDEREFEVEIENVPVGLYAVMVAGVKVGDLEVVENDGETMGELEFSDPQEPDSLLLDFDPHGEIIEVLQDGVVILEVLFPDE